MLREFACEKYLRNLKIHWIAYFETVHAKNKIYKTFNLIYHIVKNFVVCQYNARIVLLLEQMDPFIIARVNIYKDFEKTRFQ